MFKLEYEPVSRVLRVTTAGYLTVEDVARYAIDRDIAAAAARQRSGRLRMYIDGTDSRVQPAVVIAAFNALPSIVTEPDDRLAVVVTSSLSMLQVKRTLRNERERAFAATSEAMAWLTQD